MEDFAKIQDFQLIDFGTVEFPTDFNADINVDIDHSKFPFATENYKKIKEKILRYEGTNDFGYWFCLNLEMNEYLLYRRITHEQCLSLSYFLKRLEESNEELKETLRTWREDESKLSPLHQVMVYNVLTTYYVIFLDSYTRHYYEFNPSDRLNEFISKYHPRLLKKSSDFGRIRSDFGRIRKENYDEFIEELRKRTRFNEFHKLYGRKYNLFEWETNIFYFYVSIDEDGLLQYFFVE